ncbi:MAG: hypothetical protein HUU29_14320, partial [Planctomycetaceae bacterium]|nr:hypothetical protein [Planctomycetaceae bacterium]
LMTPSKDLSDATIDDIIDFIEAGGPGLQAIKLREMNTTDIPLGRQLFMGEVRLANGGPACISCHTTGDAGFWGGGTLAKDLTKAADRNGGVAGLQAALTSPQFIVMKEIFAKAPLTENEVVALSAYLGDVAKKDEQPVSGFWFIALAVFGAVDLILLSQMVWVKRFDAVRKPLIRETYQGG